MCLAIPGKITAIPTVLDDLFRVAKVSFGGIQKDVDLTMVPEAQIGDYVLVHVGVAISVVDEEEAKKTFEYLQQIGELEELGPEGEATG
ncbi:MAG: HypC/HybG/HupF family hydrogenase formation chaperone [Lewinellaceae bacterium]|nr:HypC/HybG/HupF family hydrogenase formation chaperone [Phaeodactylibacter sp.]MCB9036626.1 HypC/HybG/HupF family hydrogenase formation chaperone [Lewinellaceae bacterium]